ncbi:MAG: hypothetical protein U0L18_09020 [Acutalibacteraceae bacterium]|nr:hypothetical protein [Acutalibacteraceae bacterium]
MTITEAREIMRRDGIKNVRSYKVKYRVDAFEIVFHSEKTGKKCIVSDREDIGGFTGAALR